MRKTAGERKAVVAIEACPRRVEGSLSSRMAQWSVSASYPHRPHYCMRQFSLFWAPVTSGNQRCPSIFSNWVRGIHAFSTGAHYFRATLVPRWFCSALYRLGEQLAPLG